MIPRHILITDTETGGLDPAVHPCVEVAAIIYDVEHACAVESFASLIQAPSNEAEAINRIPAEILPGMPPARDVWARVEVLTRGVDAYLAQNAPFDQGFYPPEIARLRPWIDSKTDLAWPKSRLGEGLVAMTLAHDLGVAVAHRALADCDMLARLLTRVREMGVELGPFLARGLRPKVLFEVADRRFDEARNATAKAHGFQFFKPNKTWRRSMAREDVGALPFDVREVA